MWAASRNQVPTVMRRLPIENLVWRDRMDQRRPRLEERVYSYGKRIARGSFHQPMTQRTGRSEDRQIPITTKLTLCDSGSDVISIVVPRAQLLPPSPASSFKGDWVLFHPVYTPEELKAAEVSGMLGPVSPARSLILPMDHVPRNQDLSGQGRCQVRQTPKLYQPFVIITLVPSLTSHVQMGI